MVEQAGRQNGWFRKQPFMQANAMSLPLRDGSVDLLFTNLMLQWCDYKQTFAEFRRVLSDDGLLMFSSFGTDTLKELKAAWADVDDRPHVIDFADMHDLGDELLRAGFRQPVMDADRFTLTYADVLGLLRDLHGIGSRNIMRDRNRGLMGRGTLAALEHAYRKFADSESRLPASYEVVYGHAWDGGSIQPASTDSMNGVVQVPVDMLGKKS
jgi:malonyl-CoA O-methyltransferase